MADKVTLKMIDGMHLEAYTTGYDEPLPLDSDVSVGGQGKGHRPLEMLLVGLAGCMMMDAISILKKKRQDFTHFDVEIDRQQASEHPRVYTAIDLHFTAAGPNISEEALARALELSFTKYCPANAMLQASADIKYTYEIVDVPEPIEM